MISVDLRHHPLDLNTRDRSKEAQDIGQLRQRYLPITVGVDALEDPFNLSHLFIIVGHFFLCGVDWVCLDGLDSLWIWRGKMRGEKEALLKRSVWPTKRIRWGKDSLHLEQISQQKATVCGDFCNETRICSGKKSVVLSTTYSDFMERHQHLVLSHTYLLILIKRLGKRGKVTLIFHWFLRDIFYSIFAGDLDPRGWVV